MALSNGDGTFQAPQFVLADFGFEAGGWRVDRHPRFLADITGDGRADIVGFGDAGVWTALSNGDGTFQAPQFVLADFGFEAGGWRVDKHPRFLADITGDGRADIVGFGDAGVWTALSNGDGTFQAPAFVLADFGFEAGGWRVERHPRFLADITGDGRADIVGFGDDGVFVAFSNGDGSFAFTPQLALEDFGYSQGWRVENHLRFLADVTGEGRADIVGFGDAGVLVSPALAGGTFRERPLFVIPNFGRNAERPRRAGGAIPAGSEHRHRAGLGRPRGHGVLRRQQHEPAALEMDGGHGRLATARPGTEAPAGRSASSSALTTRTCST